MSSVSGDIASDAEGQEIGVEPGAHPASQPDHPATHAGVVEPPSVDGGNPSAASSSSDGIAAPSWDQASQRIARLQQHRKELKAQAKKAAKEMKAAVRQKRKTTRNARKLSNEELVQIVMERKIQEEVTRQAQLTVAARMAQGEADATSSS